MGQPDHRPLLEPVVSGAGCDLEDLTVSLAGKRRRIEIVIDRDGGVDLDLIAEVSRAASAALDEGDVGDAPYILEVTSPGTDRPLTQPRHWRRNVGRLVEVELDSGATMIGRIRSVSAEGDADPVVVFDVEGEARDLPLTQLVSGRVQLEFRRPEEGK